MKTQQGLTLVELMVTLAVAIILVAVGMPLFSGVAANNRATTQANTFLTAFKLARSEAIRRGTGVSVCAIADPTANPIVCGSNSDWDNGLLVFTDGGTAGTVDGGDERLKVFALTIDGATAVTTGAFVTYQAQGEVAALTANAGVCATSGSCIQLGQNESTGNQQRCLHIMNSGQVRLNRGVCS
ncbi:MAG: GspH/FimT family pseudopilin [Gammaproteobacteria bacterium]|nr:GspH/FimT family pseudopilin [Gammaproteobacteria bacterium]